MTAPGQEISLTASEARSIEQELLTGIAQMRRASENLVKITSDLAAHGMQGLAGPALARKQSELFQEAEKLAHVSTERAIGLGHYANVTEATQAEGAARAASSA